MSNEKKSTAPGSTGAVVRQGQDGQSGEVFWRNWPKEIPPDSGDYFVRFCTAHGIAVGTDSFVAKKWWDHKKIRSWAFIPPKDA